MKPICLQKYWTQPPMIPYTVHKMADFDLGHFNSPKEGAENSDDEENSFTYNGDEETGETVNISMTWGNGEDVPTGVTE